MHDCHCSGNEIITCNTSFCLFLTDYLMHKIESQQSINKEKVCCFESYSIRDGFQRVMKLQDTFFKSTFSCPAVKYSSGCLYANGSCFSDITACGALAWHLDVHWGHAYKMTRFVCICLLTARCQRQVQFSAFPASDSEGQWGKCFYTQMMFFDVL